MKNYYSFRILGNRLIIVAFKNINKYAMDYKF
jgi:hypothetical protein